MSITKKTEQKSNDEEGMSFNQLIVGLQRPDVNDGSYFKKMPRFLKGGGSRLSKTVHFSNRVGPSSRSGSSMFLRGRPTRME